MRFPARANPPSPFLPDFFLFFSLQTSSLHRAFSVLDMAQKREKEETDLKVPENLLRTARIPSLIKSSTADDSISRSSESVDPGHLAVNRQIRMVTEAETSRLYSGESSSSSEGAVSPVVFSAQPFPSKRRVINRCSGCSRKVGITGFRCRCGDMFCWEHRYSDRHDCSFDYKAAGREMIARENPVVRASKILKV